MKALDGIQIEYFVIGSVAFLWLLPWFAMLFGADPLVHHKEIAGVVAAGIVPALYVLGMLFDSLGAILTKEKKKLIEARVWSELKEKMGDDAWNDMKRKIEGALYKDPSNMNPSDKEDNNKKWPSSQLIQVLAFYYEPSLAAEIEARSTRDRVARGSLTATLVAGFLLAVFSAYSQGHSWHNAFEISAIIAALVILPLFVLWIRLQRLSEQYESYVCLALTGHAGETTAVKL